jgi:hypothetical protein
MPVTNTDAVLWYKVGIFGEIGYGVPNYSDDVGSLNQNILDFVHLAGRNLFHIMHHEDVDLRTPPSINTLRRFHKLYMRSVQVLAGRAVPPGENNLETKHVNPGGEMFKVFPVPYFRVRNQYMKRWAGLIMMSLAEAMQHTENRKAVEISTTFAGQIGQYFTRVYANMAIELFGKTREQVSAPGFLLTEEELIAYDPTIWFTSTELVDTVPPLNYVLTEDRLAVLSEGINTTDLPALQPWPTNLTTFYERQNEGDSNAIDRQLGEANTASSSTNRVGTMPPAPGP